MTVMQRRPDGAEPPKPRPTKKRKAVRRKARKPANKAAPAAENKENN